MADPEKPAAKRPHDAAKRIGGPRGLNVALARLTNPLVKRRGAAFGDILARWPEIVGPLLSADTQPEKLHYGAKDGHGATLEVAVTGAQALELQHLAPLVVERINSYFGYRVVAGLKLKQMPVRPRVAAAPPMRHSRRLSPDEAKRLGEMLSDVDDKNLRQALETLGRSLLGSV
ncbi:DciA family protein [Ferrovibrio sp.]|uniref:DUF721 domain-containing protein n=1 Tax=Ferrovibrio sp. TaxID=1917215 RepID=UPI001B76DF79|nr:DciA family protein [Ferrovibrio sp.]MBP7064029.1 DUF721 domain-containing protein [Ferrovibrio sp.]